MINQEDIEDNLTDQLEDIKTILQSTKNDAEFYRYLYYALRFSLKHLGKSPYLDHVSSGRVLQKEEQTQERRRAWIENNRNNQYRYRYETWKNDEKFGDYVSENEYREDR